MEKRGASLIIPLLTLIILTVIAVAIIMFLNEREDIKSSPVGQITIDLEKELGISDTEVVDSGTYTKLEIEQMKNLLEGFIESYSQQTNLEKLYYVSGDAEKITIMEYKETQFEEGLKLAKGNVESKEFPRDTSKEEGEMIIIGEEIYRFNLKENENFYFVLLKTNNQEKTFKN